jgi:hypothetical protein
MHTHQQAFVDAFKAWNAEAMADALTHIVEELGQVECSADTRSNLIWVCRELLDKVEGIFAGGSKLIDVLEVPFTLHLNARVQRSNGATPAIHPALTLRLALAPGDPEPLKQRWKALGFVSDVITLARDDVQTPGPLHGEPGYSSDAPDKPSVHRRRGDLKAKTAQTYAHALAVEANGPKPLLDRYRAGECEQVWEELRVLGERVREESILPDAVAVARETMQRCRDNIERLVERLQLMGYQFRKPEKAFVPPAADVLAEIADIENRVGPLPLSVCAWYEIVGSVDFIGRHPDSPEALTGQFTDPLFVFPGSYVLKYKEDNWYREEYPLRLAPDEYHKEDVSGGPPYTIWLPNAAIDTPLENERHHTTFVDYLLMCFRWGAFPGWDRLEANKRRSELHRELTRDLVAI